MTKVSVYNLAGKKVSDIELNQDVFGIEPHKQTMFEAIVMHQAGLRQGTHDTKTRGEVSGGGKKPWRQKGTGRARQGSTRSPQWVGGGTVFGPTPRNYGKKMNRKAYQLALKSLLSSKVLEEKLIVIDSAELEAPKTKTAIAAFTALNANKPLVITDKVIENLWLSVRNVPGAMTLTQASAGVLDLAKADTVIVTVDAIKKYEEVLGKC